MRWGPAKVLVPLAENQEAVKSKEDVLGLIKISSSDADQDSNISGAMVISTVAIVLSVVVLSILACLFALRVAKPDEFAQLLHPGLMKHTGGEETKNKGEIL